MAGIGFLFCPTAGCYWRKSLSAFVVLLSSLASFETVPKAGVGFPAGCVERSATHQWARFCDWCVARTLVRLELHRISRVKVPAGGVLALRNRR